MMCEQMMMADGVLEKMQLILHMSTTGGCRQLLLDDGDDDDGRWWLLEASF